MVDAVILRQELGGLLRYSEKGLEISGSPLWLQGGSTQGVTFFSSALQKMGSFRSAITSHETLRILKHQGNPLNRPLICELNHPFALGALELELLPSGLLPGGASLWVKDPRFGSLLYSKGLSFVEDSCLGRGCQIKFADHLILEASEPLNPQPSPSTKLTSHELFRLGLKSLLEELEEALHDHQTQIHLFVDSLPLGPILHRELQGQGGFAPDRPFQKIAALYGELGWLEKPSHKGDCGIKSRIFLHPLRSLKSSLRQISSRHLVFFVSSKLSQTMFLDRNLSAHEKRFYYLPLGPTQEELETLARASKCSYLYFFGPYAGDYKNQISTPNHIKKEALSLNGQSSLF